MERRRNKAWRPADEAVRGAGKQIDKPLLVGWIDREDIYERDDAAFIRRLAHGECLVSFWSGGALAQRSAILDWRTACDISRQSIKWRAYGRSKSHPKRYSLSAPSVRHPVRHDQPRHRIVRSPGTPRQTAWAA